jgi:hypothetical protein
MSAGDAAREELDEGGEILIGGEVSSVRVADERVALDRSPVINGQIRPSIGEELSPERTKSLWDLRDTGETVYAQVQDDPAEPSTDAMTRDGDTRAGAEELLSGELIVGTSSGEVGDELVATCKKVVNEQSRMGMKRRKEGLTLVQELSVRLEMVGGAGVVSNQEVVAAVGQAPLLAVITEGAWSTVVTFAVAEDAIGASRVELKGGKTEN